MVRRALVSVMFGAAATAAAFGCSSFGAAPASVQSSDAAPSGDASSADVADASAPDAGPACATLVAADFETSAAPVQGGFSAQHTELVGTLEVAAFDGGSALHPMLGVFDIGTAEAFVSRALDPPSYARIRATIANGTPGLDSYAEILALRTNGPAGKVGIRIAEGAQLVVFESDLAGRERSLPSEVYVLTWVPVRVDLVIRYSNTGNAVAAALNGAPFVTGTPLEIVTARPTAAGTFSAGIVLAKPTGGGGLYVDDVSLCVAP